MLTTKKVHSYSPELKKYTENHLCHSLKRAEENYLLTNLQTRAGETISKIQEVQRRKPKGMKKAFEEDVENGYLDTAIVRKKLKRIFPLDVFDKKKETAILHSPTYKIKKSGRDEKKSDELNQDETENRNNTMPHKASLENYRERLNYSSEKNPVIRKCLVPYIKSKKSILKQQLDTYISGIEELKRIKEKYCLDKYILLLK